MDLLVFATSNYADPFDEDWNSDLRYTVSFLRRHNIQAEFIYLPVLESAADLQHYGEEKPRTVYLEITAENCNPVLGFLKILKEAYPETGVIVGGIPATMQPEKLLQDHEEINFIIAGERDFTLLETVERLRDGRSLDDVSGLNSRGFQNPPRPLMADLDILGNMIHDGLDELLAKHDPQERAGYLISSRGCYGNCSFCGVPAFYRRAAGSPWRGRSARAIVGELRELVAKYQIRYFVFQDDNFMGPGRKGQERAQQIALEILHSDLKIQYSVCCRLNDIRADTFALLIESGLSRVAVSIESTNQESLDLLNKGLNAEDIYPTLKLIEELQIACEINLIFFDPYLTLQGVRRNLALIDYLHNKDCFSYSNAFPFNELKPFPWSKVAGRLKSEGLLNEGSYTCRFRDPAVERLVDFVRRLKGHLQITFKKRLLFHTLDSVRQKVYDRELLQSLDFLSSGLRYWMGFTLLPRFITNVCDILENNGVNAGEELNKLEELFKEKAKTLHVLERQLVDTLYH